MQNRCVAVNAPVLAVERLIEVALAAVENRQRFVRSLHSLFLLRNWLYLTVCPPLPTRAGLLGLARKRPEYRDLGVD